MPTRPTLLRCKDETTNKPTDLISKALSEGMFSSIQAIAVAQSLESGGKDPSHQRPVANMPLTASIEGALIGLKLIQQDHGIRPDHPSGAFDLHHGAQRQKDR